MSNSILHVDRRGSLTENSNDYIYSYDISSLDTSNVMFGGYCYAYEDILTHIKTQLESKHIKSLLDFDKINTYLTSYYNEQGSENKHTGIEVILFNTYVNIYDYNDVDKVHNTLYNVDYEHWLKSYDILDSNYKNMLMNDYDK